MTRTARPRDHSTTRAMRRPIIGAHSLERPEAGATALSPSAPYDAQPAPLRLEPEAETHAQVREAGIVLGKVGVGNVIEKKRDVRAPREAITEIEFLVEQDARPQPFVIAGGRTRLVGAGVDGAAQAELPEETVARMEAVAQEIAGPGEAEVAVAVLPFGVDGNAEIGARRPEPVEEARRRKQHLAVDVDATFFVVAADRNVMVQDTQLHFVDDAVCGASRERNERQHRCRDRGGNFLPHAHLPAAPFIPIGRLLWPKTPPLPSDSKVFGGFISAAPEPPTRPADGHFAESRARAQAAPPATCCRSRAAGDAAAAHNCRDATLPGPSRRQ